MPGGYRIWDNKRRRWWGELYDLCPDDLLDELNGEANYEKITALLKRYRAQKREAAVGAVARVVPVERMYCLSLGSQPGNAHLHGHVAPLPPGVPYDWQQHYALMAENGVLDVDDSAQADLARAIRSRL